MTDQDKAQCDECRGFFAKKDLQVFINTAVFNCPTCRRTNAGKIDGPVNILLALSWDELTALDSYLDGEVGIETLEIIDEQVKPAVKHLIIKILRKATKKDNG